MGRDCPLSYICKASITLTIAFAVMVGASPSIAEDAESVVKTAVQIDAGINEALTALYKNDPITSTLADKAVAVLVFPELQKTATKVGERYGEGALRLIGDTTRYYSVTWQPTSSTQNEWQAAFKTYGLAMYFLNLAAVEYLLNNDDWEVGAGPTLVGGNRGWCPCTGTDGLREDIAVVFFGQNGMMAGPGVKGSMISKIER